MLYVTLANHLIRKLFFAVPHIVVQFENGRDMPVSEKTNIKYENEKTLDALKDLKMGQKVLAYWPVLEEFYLAEVVQICLTETGKYLQKFTNMLFYEYVILIIEILLILLIIYFIQLLLQLHR